MAGPEPAVACGVHAGTYQQLFHSEQQISGKECAMVDLDPTVSDCAHVGPYQQLSHPEQLIADKQFVTADPEPVMVRVSLIVHADSTSARCSKLLARSA